jgi:hypothetical protein
MRCTEKALAAILLLLAVSEAGHVTSKSPTKIPADPLCKLLAHASRYDNTTVTVEGVYLRLPHGSVLTAPRCLLSPRPAANLRLAPDFHQKDKIMKTLWSLTEKWEPVKVILRGKLRVAKQGQGFGQGVEPYEIEVSKFLSASRLQEEEAHP